MPGQRAVVAASVAGAAIEVYDFLLFSFFATYIGPAFFPAADARTSLLLTLAVFGAGFVTRPIGAFVIGRYADRNGRRPALVLTMLLVTAGTLGLALTPTYASIGMAAPVLMLVWRLLQGFALGGEIGPSSAFLLEIAPPGRRALYSSWAYAGQGLAVLLAGLCSMAVVLALPEAAVREWGWRIPFFVGMLLFPIALHLRRKMPETAAPRPAGRAPRLRQHKLLLTVAFFFIAGATISNYVSQYMTTYAIATLGLSAKVSFATTLVVGVATFLPALAGGWLADRFGRKPAVVLPRVLLALVAVPAFSMLVAYPSAPALFAVAALIAALGAMSGGAAFTLIMELLPGPLRSQGLALAYAAGVAVFGGSAQFIVTWLIGVTGVQTAPAWYVALTSLLAAAGAALLPESRYRVEQDPAD
ncbi:MFS transporter [Ramlibacter humi]|nr:MFS transporter [Ramlibacter humi]